MQIELARKDEILREVGGWLPFEASAKDLPGHTFAAFEKGVLIAVAALRLAEGPLCFLDSMATNPNATAELRHAGIEALVDHILVTARELGFKGIACSTANPSILQRALARGFIPIPEIALVRAL